DRIEIAGDKKGRTIGSGRQKQARIWSRPKRASIDPGEAPRCPGGHRLLAASPGGARVMSGQPDLKTPFDTLYPAAFMQIGGGRTERVRDGIDDILAAIAIEIDGRPQKSRRHELGVAKGAGPGAVELRKIDIAVLNNF